ncbi:hypothetical protein QJS10_CPA03g01584 [Acorus calamus]|uniref:Uncharacterized protein n=1 Tax=Acorus calamus TaxID=4465 RepID=A0AAV9F5S9_ACOCL|nr:hypothetical protein QJS10_CPA03g01584 [Acorus calamus]
MNPFSDDSFTSTTTQNPHIPNSSARAPTSNSGVVKAIVISGERIFTGHQDGKIRVWRVSSKNPSVGAA